MRTTITLAEDVAREVERLRASEGIGPSEALNALARRGMVLHAQPRPTYVHHAADVGLLVDVSDIGDVLDLLDETR